jgi:hypothetical protein
MFQELIETVIVNISTVRSIIQTNDRLREIIFSKSPIIEQESKENTELILLRQVVPSTTDWRVYDHCAVVTRLYAIYESFVEDLVTDWILYLPEIFPCYSDLAEEIRGTHQIGVAQLLQELKKKKSRFAHLSVEEVIRGLFFGVAGGESKYDLVPDAFLLHDQNLRKEALEKLFANAGIQSAWNWVEKHRDIRLFVEEVLGSENTAEGELNELISYRNDAAHSAVIDNVLGSSTLLELCNFVEVLCQALAELVTYQVIERKKLIGRARAIGRITRWFTDIQATRAKVKEATLSVGESIFLVSDTKACCKLVKIENIRIIEDGQEVNKEQVKITTEIEIGLKFDIEARKGLLLYLVE